MLEEYVVKQQELPIHLLKTEKYKTTNIALHLKTDLTKEKATHRALLSNVLKSATKNYPSRKDIRLYLDELYGATLATNVQKIGDWHILSFYLTVVNDQFIETSQLFKKSIAFLQEVLFEPYLDEEGFFSEKIIEEEKRLLKQRIDSIYDDKIRYANERLIQEMCKNDPFAIHPYGDKNMLFEVTKQSLQEEYHRMLQEDDIRLYIVGNHTKEEVQDAVASISISPRPKRERKIPSQRRREEKEVREVVEIDQIGQAKLSMGFCFPVYHADQNFYAAQVMNGLFGGFPHSKLFMNVREKESLAYYATSRYESAKGLLFVYAGIDASQYDKTTRIIKEQLEDMVQGKFTDQELAQTKMMLKNQLMEAYDSPRSIISMAYKGNVLGKERDLNTWMKGIESVTKDEVVHVAKLVTLDTCYVLRGEDA
ncbi:EF-P 5-aminopentanol modification-associated protein YfmF [Aliibacillus thermotolerans]|uniref:EF-P 5-aminopentanol modification-associated protein YfmF n=1 Tax=Aliibacillus thermotolerans TaxID=1834418 RepID=A0ABW0U4S3_9BACI|nr:pitrilysin family protein [Aliibacillus thermotolerans]MDA3130554.1 insulinase family protein [Aliibacillus thermotolerans]